MRLTRVKFSSIKAFDSEQSIELAGVNLLYGANSSGKSSVIQSMLLLRQSAQRAYGADAGVLEFRGESADLGGFRTFVHNHETARSIAISLGLDGASEAFHYPRLFDDSLELGLKFGLVDPANPEPNVVGVRLSDARGELRFEWDSSQDGLKLADAASSASLVDRFITFYNTEQQRGRKRELPSEADRRWLREWARKHVCVVSGWLPVWRPTDVGRGKVGRPYGGSIKSPRWRLLQEFVYTWSDWAGYFSFQLSRMLDDLKYVGPLRDFPRRVVTEASDAVDLGVRGERLVLHLARQPELVQHVNRAFEQMEIGYSLSVERLQADGVEDALGDVAIAVLRDKHTGVSVSPADVGFGLSQILPVVVQLVGNHGSLILIEQPEIHLHPKMQSRLADLVIDSMVRGRNRVLIETHSEHLLVRLQRRIRERAVSGFDSADLTVNYVAAGQSGSEVSTLRIDERGGLIDPWPEGFFDERITDLFSGI